MNHLIVLYKWVLYLSLSASILILFVLLIKKLLKQKLRLQIQYAMWILILIRLIMPALPESPFSIFNVVPVSFNRPPVVSAIDNFDYDQYLTEGLDEKATESVQGNKNYRYLGSNITINNAMVPASTIKLTFIIWDIGVILGIIYIVMSYILCLKKINKCKLIEDKNIIDILKKCKSDMHIKRNIAIVQGSNIKSPAIFSLFKPKILIPLNIIENMSDNDIRNIFLHELSHYKRKDMFINYIIRIINVIHWFNPLIWYFINELKKDMELSCDQFALCYVKSDKLKDYGYTMIDVIKYSKLNEKRELNMAVGISVNITDMTKRMNMIKQFKRNSHKTIMSSLFILSLLSIIMLTEAKINSVFSEDVSNNQITSKYIVDELGRNKIVDKIDYPYEYDPKVEGCWIGVDLVGYVSDFKKDKKSWNGDLFIKELTFFKDGTTNYEWLTWTKGIAIDKTYKLSSQYFIKDIDGESYMFFQWKGGDYAYGCRRPMYYVLKKVKAFSNENVQ